MSCSGYEAGDLLIWRGRLDVKCCEGPWSHNHRDWPHVYERGGPAYCSRTIYTVCAEWTGREVGMFRIADWDDASDASFAASVQGAGSY